MKIAAACLLLVVSYVPTPVRAQEAPAPEAAAVPQGRLAPGAPVERELAGGGAHVFEVALDANAFCYLVVEQNGVDVVLRAYAPDGAKLQEADQPNGLKGPERVAFVSATVGVYRLEVRSLDAKAAAGRYAARVEQLRPAVAGDEKRVEAMRLDDAARLLVIQRTPEARRGVVERYTRAAGLWHEIGDFD